VIDESQIRQQQNAYQILYGWRRYLGYSESLKEQCHDIFDLGFFNESGSPQP
jgi:hypothetical protein